MSILLCCYLRLGYHSDVIILPMHDTDMTMVMLEFEIVFKWSAKENTCAQPISKLDLQFELQQVSIR